MGETIIPPAGLRRRFEEGTWQFLVEAFVQLARSPLRPNGKGFSGPRNDNTTGRSAARCSGQLSGAWPGSVGRSWGAGGPHRHQLITLGGHVSKW